MPRYDVFIAYAGPNAAHARELYDALAATLGKDRVFFDREQPPGTLWYREVPKALVDSRVTAAVLARAPDGGWYDKDEFILAIDEVRHGDQLLIPVFVDGSPERMRDWPYGLQGLTAIDARVRGGMAAAAAAIVERLRTLPPSGVPEPSRPRTRRELLNAALHLAPELVAREPKERGAVPACAAMATSCGRRWHHLSASSARCSSSPVTSSASCPSPSCGAASSTTSVFRETTAWPKFWRRISPDVEGGARKKALKVFLKLRRVPRLTKKPATAELLVWMEALTTVFDGGEQSLDAFADWVEDPVDHPEPGWRQLPGLSSLLKLREDLETAGASGEPAAGGALG